MFITFENFASDSSLVAYVSLVGVCAIRVEEKSNPKDRATELNPRVINFLFFMISLCLIFKEDIISLNIKHKLAFFLYNVQK